MCCLHGCLNVCSLVGACSGAWLQGLSLHEDRGFGIVHQIRTAVTVAASRVSFIYGLCSELSEVSLSAVSCNSFVCLYRDRVARRKAVLRVPRCACGLYHHSRPLLAGRWPLPPPVCVCEAWCEAGRQDSHQVGIPTSTGRRRGETERRRGGMGYGEGSSGTGSKPGNE